MSINIENLTSLLEFRYQDKTKYNSKAGLYVLALMDKHISKEEYDSARSYYGKTWSFVEEEEF